MGLGSLKVEKPTVIYTKLYLHIPNNLYDGNFGYFQEKNENPLKISRSESESTNK